VLSSSSFVLPQVLLYASARFACSLVGGALSLEPHKSFGPLFPCKGAYAKCKEGGSCRFYVERYVGTSKLYVLTGKSK